MKIAKYLLGVLILASCSHPESPSQISREDSLEDLLIQMEAQRKVDSITSAYLAAAQPLSTSQDEYRDSIQILKQYTSDPNSAGGVDMNIVWKNKSKTKIVKYIYFTCNAINRVGDEVYCSIRGRRKEQLKVTGPIKPGQTEGYGTYWSTVWYNYSIQTARVSHVRIEYMDGTEVEFDVEVKI